MPSLIEGDIYDTNQPFCNITLKLHEQIRTQRRTYSKLFSIWGDVGGFMEFIKLSLTLFTFFIIDLLYQISIANKLFTLQKTKEDKKTNLFRKAITLAKIKTFFKSFTKSNTFKKNMTLKSKKNYDINEVIESKKIKYCNYIPNSDKFELSNPPKKKEKSISEENGKSIEVVNLNIQNMKQKALKSEKLEKVEMYLDKETNIGDSDKIKTESIKFNSLLCLNLLFFKALFCFKIKRRYDSKFLELAMESFTEKMDIFNIYKIISEKKALSYEKEIIYV